MRGSRDRLFDANAGFIVGNRVAKSRANFSDHSLVAEFRPGAAKMGLQIAIANSSGFFRAINWPLHDPNEIVEKFEKRMDLKIFNKFSTSVRIDWKVIEIHSETK